MPGVHRNRKSERSQLDLRRHKEVQLLKCVCFAPFINRIAALVHVHRLQFRVGEPKGAGVVG